MYAELALTLYDQYGNITTDLTGSSIEATAHGPATVQFVKSPDGSYRSCCIPTVL